MNPRPDRMLFVLAQGRSGTAFLSDLLGRDPRSRIRHEPWLGDPLILGLSRYGRSERAVESLLEERFAALLADPVEIYGEVNSFLRYNADWLRRRFDPFLLHLTRDGRDFVRSAHQRPVLTLSQRQLPIVPADDDPAAAQWPGWSRFERVCWIWRHTNEMLAESVAQHARLEDLLSSYAAFRSTLLEPTGLQISETMWRRCVNRPRNTSAHFRARQAARRLLGRKPAAVERLPHWSAWDDEQTERFWRICGATMERLGYARDVATPSPIDPPGG